MPFERILSTDDERLIDYRCVADPAFGRARGVFVAEGRLVVTRLLTESRWRVRSILVNDAAHAALAQTLEAAACPVYVCNTAAFLNVTGYPIHRGCLAVVERGDSESVHDLLRRTDLAVILDGVSNPDNIGGVFRNAAAFGAGAVLLSPTCGDPLYRKAVRTSMAATLQVPFAWLTGWPRSLGDVHAEGFLLVALTPRHPSRSLEAFVATRPARARIALIAGAEGEGLSREAEAAADACVHIPTARAVDSLNVAVATALALYRLGSPDAGQQPNLRGKGSR